MAKADKASKARAARAGGPLGGTVGGTGGGIGGDLEIDWLGSIVVRRLEATPTAIAAFGSATLHWDVEGVGPPVRLTLGGMQIGHSGSMVIRPTESNTYRLFALAGNRSRFLGEIDVQVLHDHCMRTASTNVDELFAGALKGALLQRGDLYFRHVRQPDGTLQPSEPHATITNNQISFSALLKAEVDWLPNPDVNIHGSFGLTVMPTTIGLNSILVDTELAARDIDVRVDVSFPWHAYLVPGAIIGLPIASSMAEDKSKVAIAEGIRTFVRSLNFVPPKAGLVMHGVRVYVDGYGDGTVELEFCPPPRPGISLDNP